MSPIDDWEFWGEDPWYSGAIWKEFVTGAQIACATNVECSLTYEAKPTFDIQLESTVEVEDTYEPQTGASISMSSLVNNIPLNIDMTLDTGNITCTSTVSATMGVTFSEEINIISASTVTVNETHELFFPDDINKLITWLHGTDYQNIINQSTGTAIADPVAESGCRVKFWANSSGATVVAGQLNTDKQPIWTWDAGSEVGYLTFSASSLEHLVAYYSGLGSLGNYTVFAVVGSSASDDYLSWYVDLPNGEGSRRFRRAFGTTDVHAFVDSGGTERGVSRSKSGFIIATQVNGSSTATYIIRNSGGETTDTSHTSVFTAGTSHNLVLGGRSTSASNPPSVTAFLNGIIAEIAIYSGMLTANEQSALIAYFTRRGY
jgi:hypothetical protein